MPPTSGPQWFQINLSYRATTSGLTCISFFLLSISLFSPSWMEVVTQETNESSSSTGTACKTLFCSLQNKESDLTKAARILLILATATGFIAAFSLFVSCQCFIPSGRLSNMLMSSVASFTTGVLGYASMALYTTGVSWTELSSVGHMQFTWSFCLAWLVFSLYFMNGFFSLVTHILNPVAGTGWQNNQIFLEGRVLEPAAGDNMAVGSPVHPSEGHLTNPEINAFPFPSICMNSDIL